MLANTASYMPLKITTNKFRHVFGQSTRKDSCFENIHITKNAHDSNFAAVNPKFMAVVLDGVGGGAFLVHSTNQLGRVDVNAPKICGHTGPVNDLKWNPFDDHVIASASDDMTIKVWEIPEIGLCTNMTRCVFELRGHARKVTYIEWHPSAENVLLSCAFDYRCIVWDVGLSQPLNVISCHSNTVFSISWNYNGSLFATSCKDRKLRVINPRSGAVLQEGFSHHGMKSCKVVFLKNNRIFSTGFSNTGSREIAMWNAADLSKPTYRDTVDQSCGVLLPYYDPDINLIYIAGKTGEFCEDVYPPTLDINPALSSTEWSSGIDKDPVTISVKELIEKRRIGSVSRVGVLRTFTKSLQRTQVVRPVQKLQVEPNVKNVPSSLYNIHKLCTDTGKVMIPSSSQQKSEHTHQFSQLKSNVFPSKEYAAQEHTNSANLRENLHNESAEEYMRPRHQSLHGQLSSIRLQPSSQSSKTQQLSASVGNVRAADGDHHAPFRRDHIMRSSKTGQSGIGQTIKDSKSTPTAVVAQVAPHASGNNNSSQNPSLSNEQLHIAYFKQCEELKALRQECKLKDKKIAALENELFLFRSNPPNL
ncbi:hypothetical protein EB796_016321 [Bugula neritina]|uniref:Coronin n=1 Tax=Bugula neritina TaxID=10212 RepID=A0A7J7JID4_BUGNE|nr:hypothetical protein EB796_016321 [Bugula neritina]